MNTPTKILKKGFLFLGVSLLLWNCEKEEFQEGIDMVVVEQVNNNYHTRTLALDEIYGVKKYLEDMIPTSGIHKTSEIEGAIFDEDNVLEVIDSLENTNYSLRFRFADTPAGEFYNLVVGKTPDGEFKTPYVLKYTCDDAFLDNYIANDYDFYYFKGVVAMHKYTDFFSIGTFSRTTDTSCSPEYDAVGDPIACEESPVDGSSSSGGGDSTGGNYGNPNAGNNSGDSSGGSYSCSFSISTNGPCAEGGTAVHSVAACGAGTGVQYVTSIYCGMMRQTRTTSDDCPECSTGSEGGVGVNIPNIASMIRTIKDILTLQPTELYWLHNDAPNENIIEIHNYLHIGEIEGVYLEESIEFSEGLLKANIIEDNIIENNLDPCSKLILNDLKSLQENRIAKIIARFDSPNSTYNWEIKNGTPTNLDNVAETNWAIDNNNNAIDNSYLTVIKSSYTNQATNLAIARTILHEAIHAYIISYIDDLAGGNTQGFSTEFPDLWNNFISRKYGVPADNIENYQHQEMAENFINIIGDALAEYDNNQQSDTYYEYLAWGALMNTDAFSSALAPGGYMTQSEQETILIANNQEDTNGSEAKGTPCP